MALSAPVHKSGVATSNVASVATASWTPTNNRLYILAVVSRLAAGAGTPNTPTASGNGMTWVQIGAPITVTSGSSVTWKITFFRAMVSAGAAAGATTIDWAAQQQSRTIYSIDEYDGVQTGGTNGDTAVVQNGSNSNSTGGTIGSITLAAFGAAGNGAHACWVHAQAEDTIAEPSWTELFDDTGGGTGYEVEGRNSPDTTPTASWASNVVWAGFAIEIKANIVTLTTASVVHTRSSPGGVVVSPTLRPLSVVHARALNTGTIVQLSLKPASLVHTRALSPAPTVAPTLKPLSLTHTRALGSPRVALNLSIATSIVHSRSLSAGTKLSPTLKPLSIVHSRAIGNPLTVYQGAPPVIPYFRSFGRFPDWWFDPVRLHK
jgi:hypothetical protein